MKDIRQLIYSLWVFLCLFPTPAFADHLDIFDAGKTFPANFLFKDEIPSLKNLSPSDRELVLQKFLDARDQVESLAQNNLIHLGISYIYLLQKNYSKAYEFLNEGKNDEFILEDFRAYFQTVALRALAEESVLEEDYDQAIEYLEEAINKQMTLFKDFPSSPFHEDVPQILTQIETQLGDVFFNKKDYPSAWSSYNNALARECSGCKEAHLKIYTALARIYEAEEDMSEAADIHIYLLNNFSSSKTRQDALAFLEKNLEALEKINDSGKKLKQLVRNKKDESSLTVKPVARKIPKQPHVNDQLIKNLYNALSADDFPGIVKYGEKILEEFPGDENTKGIFSHLNHAILKKVRTEKWSEGMDRLVDLYPVQYMSKLASRLWEGGLPDIAQKVYQKIIDNHPTKTQACHKALYFMGRIEEDNQQYLKAIDYYEKLLEKYNWGYFTPSAQFKIPWLHRQKGQLEEAREGFNRLLKFANPDQFANSDNGFKVPDDFRPAALYWLADTERQLENYETRVTILKQLVEDFPMDFYAMVARIEMSMSPLNFLEPRSIQKSASRKWGLGEINRRRINRGEKLISIGFLEMGMKELSQITQGEDNPEFSYYLAQLYKLAGGYQKAISLSWGISRKSQHDSIPPSLAEMLFPKPYLDKAIQESSQYNMSPYLVLGLMRQESAFNKKVVSSARAIGLMQLLPTTAKHVARSMGTKPPDPDDLKKSEVNIQLGVKYLSGLLGDFEDNVIFALASYNAGPNKVRQWMKIRSHLTPLEFMESIPYKETRNYVKKVLRNYVIYKSLYGEGGIHDFQSVLTVRNN